jgi:hypothetical protein
MRARITRAAPAIDIKVSMAEVRARKEQFFLSRRLSEAMGRGARREMLYDLWA